MEVFNTHNVLDKENRAVMCSDLFAAVLGEMIWGSFLEGFLLEHCFLHVWSP